MKGAKKQSKIFLSLLQALVEKADVKYSGWRTNRQHLAGIRAEALLVTDLVIYTIENTEESEYE